MLFGSKDATQYIRLFAVSMLFATLNNTAQAVLRVFNEYAGLAATAISALPFN